MARFKILLRNVMLLGVCALLVKVLVLCGLPAWAGLIAVVLVTFGYAATRLGALSDKRIEEELHTERRR
jgi:protein-S-isoprenylcysteine O-methyltransferase Ste14